MEKPKIEGFEIRELKTQAEINKCIDLQAEIWGLDELGCMSPITLKALSSEEPKMAINLGGFLNGQLIAFQISLPTIEPSTIYVHMLGIVSKYRNLNIGTFMLNHLFNTLKQWNIKKAMWTYEPLEGRNANNYLNKSGARVIKYMPDYYQVVDEMSGGMPIDRFLVEVRLDDDFYNQKNGERKQALSFEEALSEIPIASADLLPDTDKVLIEIPADLQKLKNASLEKALKVRLDTRQLFTEYINNRHFIIDKLYTSMSENKRKNYYLLQKSTN